MTSSLRKTKLIFRQLQQQTVLLLSLWIALNWIRTQQLNALCTLCVQIYNTSVYVLLWKKSAWKRDNGMNKIKWGNKTWTNFAAEPIYKMDFEERYKSAHVARRYKAKVKSSIKRDELSICSVEPLSLLSERNDVGETSTCWGAPRWIWKPLLWLKTQQRFKVRLLCSKWAKTCWFTETSAVVSLTEAPLRGSSHWS